MPERPESSSLVSTRRLLWLAAGLCAACVGPISDFPYAGGDDDNAGQPGQGGDGGNAGGDGDSAGGDGDGSLDGESDAGLDAAVPDAGDGDLDASEPMDGAAEVRCVSDEDAGDAACDEEADAAVPEADAAVPDAGETPEPEPETL